MVRKPYPTDLTEEQWELLAPLLPAPSKWGRPLVYARREIVNAICYMLRGGCAWRLLPHDLPPWPLVYYYYRRWSRDHTLPRILDGLRDWVRQKMGRSATPSAAIIDSQSVKTTEQGGPRGYDAGKQVKGRKRHIVVDTEGFLLAAAVHPANVQDRDGARLVLARLADRFPRLQIVWADRGYTGPKLERWLQSWTSWALDIVVPDAHASGFQVQPRRWVVERTFAWLGRHRRLSKDYERLCVSAEAWMQWAMIRLLLGRLCPQKRFS